MGDYTSHDPDGMGDYMSHDKRGPLINALITGLSFLRAGACTTDGDGH